MGDLPEQLTVEHPDQPQSRCLMPASAFENWGRDKGWVEVDPTAGTSGVFADDSAEDNSVPEGWTDPAATTSDTLTADQAAEIDTPTTPDAGATGNQTEV